jgi:hypothetical protein
MLYKGGMCLGSVGRTTRGWTVVLGSKFKLHGKNVPGGREAPPGDSRPWLRPTGNPQYCALLQVEYRTLYTYVSR